MGINLDLRRSELTKHAFVPSGTLHGGERHLTRDVFHRVDVGPYVLVFDACILGGLAVGFIGAAQLSVIEVRVPVGVVIKKQPTWLEYAQPLRIGRLGMRQVPREVAAHHNVEGVAR